MNWLKKFMVMVDKTNIFLGKVNVGMIMLAVVVITFEVVARYVFGMPTNWGHELMTLLFAASYVLAGGYAHYHRAHVRVDVLYSRCSPRGKAILDCISSVFFFLFAGVMFYTSWTFYWSSQNMYGGGTLFGVDIIGEVSLTDWAPPLYPIKFMMPLGAAMLLLQGVVWLIRDLKLAFTGEEWAK